LIISWKVKFPLPWREEMEGRGINKLVEFPDSSPSPQPSLHRERGGVRGQLFWRIQRISLRTLWFHHIPVFHKSFDNIWEIKVDDLVKSQDAKRCPKDL
jgi:hypothetical protein